VKPFPYGMWTTSNGRQVIFDRAYRPLWERSIGVVRNADASEWVRDIAYSQFFFDDGQLPYRQCAGMKQLRRVLATWRLI
jgi:hypothetical protein